MKTHLFLDRRLIQPQGVRNASLHVQPIHKDTENGALFTEEFFAVPPKRWEVRYDNGYPNVLYDPQARLYRCYYTLFLEDADSASTSKQARAHTHYTPRSDRQVGLAYAQSVDGIHWEKPVLGKVLFEGSRDNNLLFRYAHGTGVMLDVWDSDPQRRYKLVTKMDFPDGRPGYMAVNFSADGVNWGEMQPWPAYNPQGDSHNFPFYDPNTNTYRVMTRCWRDGVRVITSCESKDFLHWSAPREVLRGSGFSHQVYAMPVFPYQGLYLGLAAIFHEGDRDAPDFDTVDCELYYAVTPDVFDAVAEWQPFIPRGAGEYPDGAFDCGCIYASPPVETQDRLYIYYMGGNGRHTDYRETSLGRGWIQKDHFACYQQNRPERESLLTTTRLCFTGDTLFLLADLDAESFIRCELREQWNGAACDGFSEADFRMEKCADGEFQILFAKPFSALDGRPVCLTLRFCRASIYGIKGDAVLYRHRLWEGAPSV